MNDIQIWHELGEIFRGLIGGLLSTTEQWVTEGLPRLILAAVTLIIGWLVAVFIRKLSTKGLRGVGFDLIMDRTGIRKFLDQRGVHLPPSALVGWGLFVIVMYSALILAFQRLAFQPGVALLTTIAAWVPRIIVALILLAIGNWVGRWLGRIVSRAARVADLPGDPFIGALVHLGTLLFAFMVSIRYLELASDTLLLVGLALVLGTLLLLAFLVVFCARDWLMNLLAARAVQASYQPGERIRVQEHEGEIIEITHYMVELKTAAGRTAIPAATLLRHPVIRC